MGKAVPAAVIHEGMVEGLEQAFESFRREPPVIMGMIVDGAVHDGAEDEDAARCEDAVNLSRRLSRVLHMLERIEA